MQLVTIEYSHHQGEHVPGDRDDVTEAIAAHLVRAGVARLAEDVDAEASDGPTKTELLERAKALKVEGRSSMNRDELAAAVGAAEAAAASAAP
jgi:hypothetical protein